MNHKIIVLSAMQGRQPTVEYCLSKMPFLDVVMVYSTEEDETFLEGKVKYKYQYSNEVLSEKWNHGIQRLKHIDFDAVIILGSDDYVDEAFVKYVDEKLNTYDFIGFKDFYIEYQSKFWYWSGYNGNRRGEPIGAGRVYTKELLEKIGYNLFIGQHNKSLDGISWNVIKRIHCQRLITTLRENSLFCCDVKDGGGMNPFNKIASQLRIADHL